MQILTILAIDVIFMDIKKHIFINMLYIMFLNNKAFARGSARVKPLVLGNLMYIKYIFILSNVKFKNKKIW